MSLTESPQRIVSPPSFRSAELPTYPVVLEPMHVYLEPSSMAGSVEIEVSFTIASEPPRRISVEEVSLSEVDLQSAIEGRILSELAHDLKPEETAHLKENLIGIIETEAQKEGLELTDDAIETLLNFALLIMKKVDEAARDQ